MYILIFEKVFIFLTLDTLGGFDKFIFQPNEN
jgi:hypothetical protein